MREKGKVVEGDYIKTPPVTKRVDVVESHVWSEHER